MVLLTGKNLGERQRELNSKVAEVVTKKKDFGDIKAEAETTDIDKLYKIDIASQYKDVDYIIDVLKSGDSLYISRALKCSWLYEDSYNHVINTENLHNNIFPYMSLKMKGKMLSTISMHIRHNDRAATFYTYCVTNKMPGIAKKFLNFTSEQFKMDIVREYTVKIFKKYVHGEKSLKNFVGNSFFLGINCIENNELQKRNVTHDLRFLYSVCNKKYLDILENYVWIDLDSPDSLRRFGIRISKDIMMKHKDRVLKNPLLYVNKLNKGMLVKYSTIDNAKTFIANLMPQKVKEFWKIDFCDTYEYVLDIIPMNERFEYIQQLFNCKYPDEEFEMSVHFYNLKYYEMLPISERELWALRHIDSEKEILGSGNDYIWYKFVNFDKSLVEIKKYIMIAPDKRSEILNILVECAKDPNDLIKLLNYYYERHVNENPYDKESFLNKVLNIHNVFEFNIECWEALNKLFYSLDIYTVGKYCSNWLFKTIAVYYHILHNKHMPQALVDFVDLDINYSCSEFLLENLGKEKSQIVFQYIVQHFVKKLEPFEQDFHDERLREKLVQYVYNINDILFYFCKRDEECPRIVTKFMEIHSPTQKESKIISSEDILRLLKKDANLCVQILPELAENINCSPKQLSKVLRKLKVYFPNDVAIEYINFFQQLLPKLSDDYNSSNLINTAVYGILVLGDESLKLNLMEEYKPLVSKIDHSAVDKKLLYIQKAICRLVGFCRPPIPLQSVLKYIKGDYVHYCLPMFNKYLANLPWPKAIEFTEATLNAPLSIQKHSLRLAFTCYTVKNLKELILKVWKKTKNVSLRMLLYTSLFQKIIDEDEDTQAVLYEVLKSFTSDLHKDDHNDLFHLLCSNRMPDRFKDDYLQIGWEIVTNLPEKPLNINRQVALINHIENNFTIVNREFIYKRIIEKHIHEMLEDRRLRPNEMHEMEILYKAKWELIARYISQYRNEEEMEENFKLLTFIFDKCREMWNELHNEKNFISRTFYFQLIQTIKSKILRYQKDKAVPIFQHILKTLQKALTITEIYLTVWELQVAIFAVKSEMAQCDRGETYNHVSSSEAISVNFAEQVGAFVKELVDKHQFYGVFLREITNLLQSRLLCINPIAAKETYFEMMFCETLANIGMMETYLLALMILPPEAPGDLKERHSRILSKIKKFKDDEVQSFLYSRFVLI